MLKNIFILVMFFSPSINYCADESKSLDEDEKDLGSISSSIKKTFNFISSEGTTFKVPLKIALQIPLIKAKINYQRVGDQVDYSYDFEENEISKITLGLLANALILFDKFENLENKRVLYEKIQIQDDLSLKKALECFAASVYLDFVPLANVYADQIAQHLFNEDRTFNKNNLVSVIDLFLMNSSLIDSWYLIEKFYYLRSNELRANIDNLLLNYIPELIEVLDINPGNLNYMRLNIIKKFYLSINDLIDYDKIKLDADEIIINNFSLVSIDGLKRIPNINDFNVIDVSNNLLADLGDNFQDLNDLDVLMLSHNALTDLGSNLQGLNSLTFLDLSFNQIITLGDSLQQLVALETLHLNNNLLTNLSNSLHFLIQLKSLSLHFNQLTNLGNSLHGFNALKFLSLSNNQLTNLGDSLNRLIALEELFLSNNQLNNLDGRLNGLTNLRELYLSDNTITDLGVSLQDLNNLKILDLSNNALVSLGYNSERILNLEILNVDTIQLNQESSDLVANWRAIHEGQNV